MNHFWTKNTLQVRILSGVRILLVIRTIGCKHQGIHPFHLKYKIKSSSGVEVNITFQVGGGYLVLSNGGPDDNFILYFELGGESECYVLKYRAICNTLRIL